MVSKLQILKEAFEDSFDMGRYVRFIKEFFSSGIDMVRPDRKNKHFLSEYAFYIKTHTHVANYTDPKQNKIAIFAVELNSGRNIERARSMQRNFVSKLISETKYDGALVAFYNENETRWRLSLVLIDLEFAKGKVKTTLSPAKRFSYLVGKGEPCHTAMEQLYPIFMSEDYSPTIDRIEEAFSVEAVTKEFFAKYREKYLQLKEELDSNQFFNEEAARCQFTSEQFAKKLLGQLVFIYFLQKKGWLGVKVVPQNLTKKTYKNAYYNPNKAARVVIPKMYAKTGEDEYRLRSSMLKEISDADADVLAGCFKPAPWGSGTRTFIRDIFENCFTNDKNFFDDYLEPLFYEALNYKRGENLYYKKFNCRIPFLNGGLFEPIKGYDWSYSEFRISNELFSNRHIKGERDADGILDVFERYNFTMNEDEPLEKEVAVDPEMLGKIFENLLEVKDRKSKGAFYTPREIVHYMCQESLINYLVNETEVPYDDLKVFILFGEIMKDEDCSKEAKLGEKELRIPQSVYNNLKKIDEALANVKIADPAVGSGAFPLGMLSEIVKTRNNITHYFARLETDKLNKKILFEVTRSPYSIKWETIKNSIFAVDIEASAVDIAKLRLWLSLVVDQEINTNSDDVFFKNDNADPKPLPNLDYNIMCGDSLIDEFEGIKLFDESLLEKSEQPAEEAVTSDWQKSLFQDQINVLTGELFKAQDRFFGEEDNDKKSQIKQRIDSLIDSIIRSKLSKDGNTGRITKYEESLKHMTKPYFLWKLEFARVFKEKSGFDIVIGNPPYIGEKGNKNIFRIIKATNFGERFYQRHMDIFYFFIAKGIEILKQKGLLSFITTNYWITASGGQKKLRPYIKKEVNILNYIDFGEYKIFDNALGQHNCIFLFEKNNQKKTKKTNVTKIEDVEKAKNYSLTNILYPKNTLDGISIYISQEHDNLFDKVTFNICFNNNMVFNILEKIINNSERLLGELCTISGGVSSSADKVTNSNIKHCTQEDIDKNDILLGNGILVLSKEEVNEIKFTDKEMHYIKPYFKSSEIEKYVTNNIPSKYLVYATHNNAFKIIEQQNVYSHLLRYKRILETRSQDIELERAMQKGHWFVLTNGRNRINFSQPKIVCPYRTKDNVFGYNEVEWFAGRDVYYLVDIRININYLLGLLNSKLIKFWLEHKGKKKGDIYEIYPEPLKNIPIIYSKKVLVEEVSSKTIKILSYVNKDNKYYGNSNMAKIIGLENEINHDISRIYDLTDNEKTFIEKK